MTLRTSGRAGRRLALFVIGTAAVVLGTPVQAQAAEPAAFHVVDLGVLEGTCCSSATGINDHGDMVGDSSVGSPTTARHAFRWHAGKMTDLGTLGGRNSSAKDINNRGDIVGWSDTAGGATHAVLWRNGNRIDLGTLGGANSFATAVNNRGEVVGFSGVAGSEFLRAFRWSNGRMTDLGAIKNNSEANDINDRGQIAGDSTIDGMNRVAVRWAHGGPQILIKDPPAEATAINDHGQITGFTFGDNHPFVWTHGRLTNIAKPAGSMFMQAWSINDHGQVVGDSDFGAWLWQRGTLTRLPGLAGQGAARHVNNRGQVVGFAATDPMNVNPHAVLWTR